jgi:Sulfotransferase family
MLEANRLLEEARHTAGLEDYGPMDFTEGFEILVRAINDEAGLAPEHEGAVRTRIDRVLVNKLRMQQDLRTHPEILEETLLAPVFITSLPRTGSTKLHRMLAATHDFAGIPFWMSHNFARFPESKESGRDPRIAAADEYLQWMYKRAPLFQQGHPQYAEEFEEELALLDAGFNSLYNWAALLNVPSYVDYVLASDGMQAFRDLRVLLQYLQWQHYRGQGKRWVLKTPSLFGFERAYAETFTDTDFIVSHRHPVQIWPSVCSLVLGVRSIYNDADFTATASELIMHNFGEASKMHLSWRDTYPPEKVLDVRFGEVIANEAELLRRIYDWLGMDFTVASGAHLAAWLEMDSRREHVRSTATLEDFGVTEEEVRDGMRAYIERYGEYL